MHNLKCTLYNERNFTISLRTFSRLFFVHLEVILLKWRNWKRKIPSLSLDFALEAVNWARDFWGPFSHCKKAFFPSLSCPKPDRERKERTVPQKCNFAKKNNRAYNGAIIYRCRHMCRDLVQQWFYSFLLLSRHRYPNTSPNASNLPSPESRRWTSLKACSTIVQNFATQA